MENDTNGKSIFSLLRYFFLEHFQQQMDSIDKHDFIDRLLEGYQEYEALEEEMGLENIFDSNNEY